MIFCPKCGTQSPDDLKYCRSCGTDIGLVSKALTGNLALPQSREESRRRRRRHETDDGPPQVDRAIRNAIAGLGFMVVSLGIFLFAPAGKIWFWAMLIPAFSLLGQGIAEYVKWREEGRALREPPARPSLSEPPSAAYLPPPAVTGEISPRRFESAAPPSVTEDTTRHLDRSAER